MKQYKYLLFFLFVSLLILSCDKNPLDLRNKYIDEWYFKVYYSELNTNGVGYSYYDSVNFEGYILPGVTNDEIIIEYSEDNSIRLKLDDEENLFNFPNDDCTGIFKGYDQIQLLLRWEDSEGGITHEIDGIKK